MNIKQLVEVDGARKATGLTVVIDIMRAATVEAYAFGQGAKEIFPVSTKEEAFALKKEHPEYLLMGEIEGYKIDGFDFGNSPSEIAKVNLTGKTLVQRTSSGTQGLVHALNAKELIFGSFVTCSAIVTYIKKQNPGEVSIVSIDTEDVLFANFLEESLRGIPVDKEKVRQELYAHPGVDWFLDPQKPEFLKEDIDYALNFDKFPFVCLVERLAKTLVTKKVEI